jgi:C1A family cysteine protease
MADGQVQEEEITKLKSSLQSEHRKERINGMSISRDSKDERNGTGLNIKQLAIVVCVIVFIISGTFACVLVCEKDDSIPTAYDLRDHDLMTPVRDQNGQKADGTSDIGSTVGLCWDFASLASLESNMLKQGITTDLLSPEASFSPWYVGNYIGFNDQLRIQC